MQQKWHNQTLLEAPWNRYNMQVGKAYNRNLGTAYHSPDTFPRKKLCGRHAKTSRKGTAVICFAPIMQSVTTRQAELALFVSAK